MKLSQFFLTFSLKKMRLRMSSAKSRPSCLGLDVLTKAVYYWDYHIGTGTDSRFGPSQWETALLCNDVSHWLGASLESALDTPSFMSIHLRIECIDKKNFVHPNFKYATATRWGWGGTRTVVPAMSAKRYAPWTSYQMRKIAGCACTGNAGNVFPATDFKGNR